MKNALMMTSLTALMGCAAPTESASAPARPLAQAASALHVFESDASGFHTRNFFYDNGEEVIAFDAQFTRDLARQSIAFLRSKTKNPITTLVITHPNPDKFNGLSEFQAIGAKVVASRATAEAMPGVHAYKKAFFVGASMFTDASYPILGVVDQTFENALDLRLKNGETIELRELAKPGVSSTQTVALIPSLAALLVGDLVHHRTHAWLEGGIVNGKAEPSIAGWIADLRELRSRFGSREPFAVYGGRGAAADLRLAVAEQIAYLVKAEKIVAREAQRLQGKPADYAKLAKEFEAAFPGYGLSYLIQYGAYGLLESKR